MACLEHSYGSRNDGTPFIDWTFPCQQFVRIARGLRCVRGRNLYLLPGRPSLWLSVNQQIPWQQSLCRPSRRSTLNRSFTGSLRHPTGPAPEKRASIERLPSAVNKQSRKVKFRSSLGPVIERWDPFPPFAASHITFDWSFPGKVAIVLSEFSEEVAWPIPKYPSRQSI
jgi:hypothetical protein